MLHLSPMCCHSMLLNNDAVSAAFLHCFLHSVAHFPCGRRWQTEQQLPSVACCQSSCLLVNFRASIRCVTTVVCLPSASPAPYWPTSAPATYWASCSATHLPARAQSVPRRWMCALHCWSPRCLCPTATSPLPTAPARGTCRWTQQWRRQTSSSRRCVSRWGGRLPLACEGLWETVVLPAHVGGGRVACAACGFQETWGVWAALVAV